MNIVTDVECLSNLFKTTIDLLNSQQHLQTETALLSRCIYRMKMKFRSDKGLKAMEKTNRALLQYLRLNFINTFSTFYETVPQKFDPEMYLPSRDMLDFVLVRLQGMTKLLCRIAGCAHEAALLMQNRICIGHFWKVAFICFGLLSRIWVLIKNILVHCCKVYNDLLPYREQLQSKNKWLPQEYVFPTDLKAWLEVGWILDTIIPKIPDAKLPKTNSEVEDDDVQFSSEYIDIENDSDVEMISEYTLNKEATTKSSNNLRGFDTTVVFETITNNDKSEDEVLPVVASEKSNSKKKKRKNKKKASEIEIIDSLTSLEQIKIFVRNEDNARMDDLNKSVLKKLDKLQWNMLRKKVIKVLKKSDKSESENKSVDKIREMLKVSIT